MPQGGNTGLVGGQIPLNGEVVLSLTRLDNIREVDAVSNTMTLEAGVTLQRAREAAANVDRLYPQLLPSEVGWLGGFLRSCTSLDAITGTVPSQDATQGRPR